MSNLGTLNKMGKMTDPLRPADFGPIYAETDLSRFPVEPWNTYSNLLFLGIIVYLVYSTRCNWRAFPLSVTALPILVVGFIGGTVFHATRSHSLWLILDFVPIFLLGILGACFFWNRLVTNWWLALLLVFASLALSGWVRSQPYLPRQINISLGYAGLALTILLPATLQCIKEMRSSWILLVSAAVSFSIGITFRIIDRGIGQEILPMGTHFLWHIFGAVSTWYVIKYILRCENLFRVR